MKHLYFTILLFLIVVSTSFSQVQTTGNWAAIGDSNLSIVTDDADNGDGVGDGAIYVDGQSTMAVQGIAHTFDGTMTSGESITIDTYTYNRNVSYVKFTVGLYNVTSGAQLAISSEITISNNASSPVLTTLNYTAVLSDVGDQLEVRYYRTTDFNTARNFVIDNLSLNTTFVSIDLASSCPFTVTPDLSLIASNATIEAEINTAVDRFSDAYLGTSAPSPSALASAESSYAALNINVSGGEITGNAITNFNTLSFLKTFAQHLKFNPGDTNIETKANNTVWLTSKYFCNGTLSLNSQMYDYEKFARPASLLQDFLDPDVQDLFAYTLYEHSVQFEHFWEATYDATYQETNGAINTDLIYNISDAMLAYALWHDTADERYQYMRGYKRYINRFFSRTVGTTDGIKADGTGFHHWTAYNNYMYSFNTAANLLSYLNGTSFQVDQSNYKVFSEAFYAQYIQSNDAGVQALSSAGRNPQNRTRPISQSALKTLAIEGGDILGLSTADPVLAGMYNRIYGVDVDFNYATVSNFTTGFFQFNHASASAFRKDNWVAFNKGFTNNMWGAEIYTTQNRYGRYQSYGALEVIYPGDKETGNGYDEETWDWNYNPGATVIRLPWANLHAERGRIDEAQQKRFVGALNLKNKSSDLLTNIHGDYGMFAMDFQELEGQGFSTTHSGENHNNTFTFKKSNFYFDDIIVCLASGINNDDASNETITTLYQRLDNSGIPNVNGTTQSASGEVTFSGASDNWLLSNYNTGFYLLSGNHSLKVKKEVQQTPNQNQIWPATITGNATDTYYTGYLDHGTAPVNESYEYILIPDSDATEMLALDAAIQASNKPYTVHQQNASAHIIEHEAKKIFGYSFFASAAGLTFDYVTDVDASCLVMTEYTDTNGELFVSIVNPDIGFESRAYTSSIEVTRQITLQGEWTLSGSYAGVQIISSNATETVIEFTLVDGLAKEVLLINGLFNPNYPIVYYEDFLNATGRGFEGFAVTNGGQAANQIMKRVSDIPDLSDSNNEFDPAVDRPANRIPEGSSSNQRAIATVGNNATTNFGIDAYSVFTTLDLTDTNPLINPEDTYKYASFWTERRYGNGDIATITILVSTAYTGDPSTTTWTTLPLLSGKIAESSDGLNYVNAVVDLTSFANGAEGSTVTLAYRYQGSSSTYSSSNRNGTFQFSDLQFHAQSTQHSSIPNYWNGATNTDWNTASNWSKTNVPTASENVFIPSSLTNYPIATSAVMTKSINIEPGASLTSQVALTGDVTLESISNAYSSLIVDGSISGIVNYKRYTNMLGSGTTGGNDLISSPVSGETFDDEFIRANAELVENPSDNGEFAFAPYNVSVGAYQNFDIDLNNDNNNTESFNLDSGVGYRAATISGSTLTFTGTASTTDILDVAISDAAAGFAWNLIGNPYPSYIDFDTFFTVNKAEFETVVGAYQAIYGYDATAGRWTVWNMATIEDLTITELIAPGQGFFVKAKSGGGLVDFTTGMRTTGNSDDFIFGRRDNSSVALSKLKLSSGSNNVLTNIYFIDGTTRGLDSGYDAASYSSNSAALSIFTNLIENNTGLDIVIQSLPYDDFNDVVVPLGVKAGAGVQLTIGIDALSTLPSNINVYLEDTVANSITLLNDGDYTFVSPTNLSGTGRFFIRYSSATLSLGDNQWNDLHIYTIKSPKTLFIKGQLMNGTKANLYDIQGRLILSKDLDEFSNENTIDISVISSGIYIVKVYNRDRVKTQKLIIR